MVQLIAGSNVFLNRSSFFSPNNIFYLLFDCNLFRINSSYGFEILNLLCQQPPVQLIVILSALALQVTMLGLEGLGASPCAVCVCVSSTVYMWHSLVVFGNILVVMTTFITWVVTTAVLPETHCMVQT